MCHFTGQLSEGVFFPLHLDQNPAAKSPRDAAGLSCKVGLFPSEMLCNICGISFALSERTDPSDADNQAEVSVTLSNQKQMPVNTFTRATKIMLFCVTLADLNKRYRMGMRNFASDQCGFLQFLPYAGINFC